jgi:hypothetical protein
MEEDIPGNESEDQQNVIYLLTKITNFIYIFYVNVQSILLTIKQTRRMHFD